MRDEDHRGPRGLTVSELFNEALLKHWGEREPWTETKPWPKTDQKTKPPGATYQTPRPPPPRVQALVAKVRALASELSKAADALESWRFEPEEVDAFEERFEKAYAAAFGMRARGEREELSALFASDLIRAIWKVVELQSIANASPKVAEDLSGDSALLGKAIAHLSGKPGRAKLDLETTRSIMENIKPDPSAMVKSLLRDRHPDAEKLDTALLAKAIALFSKKPGRGDRRWETIGRLMESIDLKPLGDERLKQIAAQAKTAKARKLGER